MFLYVPEGRGEETRVGQTKWYGISLLTYSLTYLLVFLTPVTYDVTARFIVTSVITVEKGQCSKSRYAIQCNRAPSLPQSSYIDNLRAAWSRARSPLCVAIKITGNKCQRRGLAGALFTLPRITVGKFLGRAEANDPRRLTLPVEPRSF